jgi:antitoxin MazE
MNAPFSKPQARSTLRKMGNSTGLIIPKPILDQLGLASGAKIELRIEDGKVIAEPVKRTVREGWEEAAREIGKHPLTEEELDWLNMPYEFDDEWEW